MTLFSTVDDTKEHIGTAYWLKYIKHRIDMNKNFMGVFIGQTGSGKSYSCISLGQKLDEQGLDKENLFLKASGFLKRLISVDMCKGRVLMWDEAGVGLNSKQWASKANRVVNSVMQVFRKENLIVLFTLPYFSFLDSDARKLVHALFETQGIDYKTKEVIIKPLLIQTNQETGKMYKKFLRVYVKGKGVIPIRKIRLPLPSEEFLKYYEEEKDKFTKELYKEAYASVMELEVKTKSNSKPLTDKQREAWDLKQQGMNPEQIAELLNKDVSTIYDRLKNAQKKQILEITI